MTECGRIECYKEKYDYWYQRAEHWYTRTDYWSEQTRQYSQEAWNLREEVLRLKAEIEERKLHGGQTLAELDAEMVAWATDEGYLEADEDIDFSFDEVAL